MYPESRTLTIDRDRTHNFTLRNRLWLGASFVLGLMLLVSGCGGGGSVTGQSTNTTASGGSGSSGSGNNGSGNNGSGNNGAGNNGGGAPQQTGTTISNVQTASGNWQSFGQIAPNYTDCPAPCSESTWKQVFGVSNPSKSGNATEFELSPKKPGADVLFTAGVVGTTSPQIPDADHKLLPTLHHFTYDADFYVSDAPTTAALEFDISLWMEGIAGVTFGTQCSHYDGDWDVWDNGNGQWMPTGVPCQFVNGWNHVTIELQRQTNNDTLYQSITLNGKTYSINKEYPPTTAPSGWWGLAANYQMDSDAQGTPITTYVDNLSITYQ
jgi:hypothetical protein